MAQHKQLELHIDVTNMKQYPSFQQSSNKQLPNRLLFHTHTGSRLTKDLSSSIRIAHRLHLLRGLAVVGALPFFTDVVVCTPLCKWSSNSFSLPERDTAWLPVAGAHTTYENQEERVIEQ